MIHRHDRVLLERVVLLIYQVGQEDGAVPKESRRRL
jgi:hypothetical protein